MADQAFDSYMIGDFLIFGDSLTNSYAIFSSIDWVCMYPAILLAFKIGGGLEISLRATYQSQMAQIFPNDPNLASLLVLFGLIQLLRPFAVHNLVYGNAQRSLEHNKFA